MAVFTYLFLNVTIRKCKNLAYICSSHCIALGKADSDIDVTEPVPWGGRVKTKLLQCKGTLVGTQAGRCCVRGMVGKEDGLR